MAKKEPEMSPERAQWEATREERERYLYRRANQIWEETKARESSEDTARARSETRWRILRRLKRFRGPLLLISSSPVHLHIPCFLDAQAVREEERHSTSVGRKVPAGYVRRSKFLPGDLTLPTMRNIYPVTSQWTGQVEK